MSTSCIVGIYDTRRPEDIVLLEKTHDGFKENVTEIIHTIVEKYDISDVEELVNALIKETSIEFAIYSHKHPYYAFIYDVYKKNIIEICIDPSINRINDCLEKIKDCIKGAKDEKTKSCN